MTRIRLPDDPSSLVSAACGAARCRRGWTHGQHQDELQERIDVEALLNSIGSLQDLRFRPAEVAYRRLRSAARSSRRPVAEVARIVVDGGPWKLPRKDS
jgi:hypothetical protein